MTRGRDILGKQLRQTNVHCVDCLSCCSLGPHVVLTNPLYVFFTSYAQGRGQPLLGVNSAIHGCSGDTITAPVAERSTPPNKEPQLAFFLNTSWHAGILLMPGGCTLMLPCSYLFLTFQPSRFILPATTSLADLSLLMCTDGLHRRKAQHGRGTSQGLAKRHMRSFFSHACLWLPAIPQVEILPESV